MCPALAAEASLILVPVACQARPLLTLTAHSDGTGVCVLSCSRANANSVSNNNDFGINSSSGVLQGKPYPDGMGCKQELAANQLTASVMRGGQYDL